MKIKSIGIIGFGDFGQFLFALAKEHLPSLEVKVFSSRKEPSEEDFFSLEDVCKTDILLVCVPISAFADTIERILPLLGEGTLVCDVATVKKYTISILKEKNVPHYLATHPMFGPASYAKHRKSLKDLRIAVCDSSLSKEELRKVISFFEVMELKVLKLNADEHDRLVAETLFLTHLVGQTIRKGHFQRTSIDTLSFGYLMDAVESVAQDEALFRDVYTYNSHCKDVLARYEKAEKEIISSLAQT
jgi:prephenate dehydrogenase